MCSVSISSSKPSVIISNTRRGPLCVEPWRSAAAHFELDVTLLASQRAHALPPEPAPAAAAGARRRGGGESVAAIVGRRRVGGASA